VLGLAKTNEILSKLDKSQNTVVVCDSQHQAKMMIDLHKAVSKKFRKICMVTIHKSFSSLMNTFKENRIDTSKYCFVDCVSTEQSETNDEDQCIQISSPVALTELAIAIEKMREKHRMDMIIFDNISAMLIYNDELTVLRFLHYMMIKVRKTDTKAVYSVLQENRKEFMADVSLFADAVIAVQG
jgi:KaiC/GvpD/RAD55 family RecA-like ATPase